MFHLEPSLFRNRVGHSGPPSEGAKNARRPCPGATFIIAKIANYSAPEGHQNRVGRAPAHGIAVFYGRIRERAVYNAGHESDGPRRTRARTACRRLLPASLH